MKTPLLQLKEDLGNTDLTGINSEEIHKLIDYYMELDEIQKKNMYNLGVQAGIDFMELGEKNKDADEIFKELYG